MLNMAFIPATFTDSGRVFLGNGELSGDFVASLITGATVLVIVISVCVTAGFFCTSGGFGSGIAGAGLKGKVLLLLGTTGGSFEGPFAKKLARAATVPVLTGRGASLELTLD